MEQAVAQATMTPREAQTQEAVRMHFEIKHRAACTLPAGTTEERRPMPIPTLGEHVMSHVADREHFTGQVHVEVHCKDGVVKDVYLSPRWKLVETKG